MNKFLYRIVFNKARGLLMVVAENVSAEGKQPGMRNAPGLRHLIARLRPLCWSALVAFGAVGVNAAQAQILADPQAPGTQRATVLSAGNGVPLVNIQTPSEAGVSRNTYKQFDVSEQGAILNNSRTATATRLGGYVAGNPWLADGTARVILNEVNASNPSLLRGYVEVGGMQAEVIIANPAGISCAGCGVINANRFTLSTGTPVLNGGNLDGYRVQSGTLAISGEGLDVRGTDYTALIARSVEINAGLWATELDISTGANAVDAEGQQIGRAHV
jgi:filamentous hemagglutinin